MNTERFAPVAEQWIHLFDNGAQRAIGAWRDGGEQLGALARERWDSALAASRKELSKETLRNAARTRQAVAGAYAKGLELSTAGAETAVGTLVQAARGAVARAEAWRAARA
ncbi:hypothetical protein LZ009_15025 [Ramlibacter sp. XY19]|uniref:hypothetical protein n=1 Tax=Ramlibacter paludis TaxID=2908000 RepID=UPI0023DC1744|nr:hypothetical protein [Ramlibacter paludis]MCG2594092.1 hypothetical protein [Ramlibacter paludis]